MNFNPMRRVIFNCGLRYRGKQRVCMDDGLGNIVWWYGFEDTLDIIKRHTLEMG